MKSSKTSFLRNCISGWNVRSSNLSNLTTEVRNLFSTFAPKFQKKVTFL